MRRRVPHIKSVSTDLPGQKKFYGIYRAKCLNNRDPEGFGRILVHVYETDGALSYDEETHEWIPVLSPYGGLPQMGFLMLPPIHSDGYVVFEGGDGTRPVWIGTFPFAALREVDREASQEAGFTVIKTRPTMPQEQAGDPGKIIIKTQYPTLEQPDVEADENIVENMIVMDRNRLQLLHINSVHYSYKQGGVAESDPSTSITLTDNGIQLKAVDSKGNTNLLEVNTSGIRMETSLGDVISMQNGLIEISGSDRCQISIKALESGAVLINGKQIVIDGEQIISGKCGPTGGGGAVTADSVCPFVGLPIHIGSSKTVIGG